MKRFGILLSLFLLIAVPCFALSGSGGGSSGASTTQGIGGGASNTPGSDSWANVKNYGAKGDGLIAYDAAMPVGPPTTTGTSTAPSAPTYTTLFNSEIVVSAIGYDSGASMSVAPTGTNLSNLSGTGMGLWLGYQSISTAGSVAANVGTITVSKPWTAWTIALYAAGGGTITVGNTTNGQTAGNSQVVNVPSGTVNGDLLVSCASGFSANQATQLVYPAGWTFLKRFDNLGARLTTACAWRHASSEPASYTWTDGNGQISASITDFQGSSVVIDNKLTSAGATFAAGDVGKLICIDGAGIGTLVGRTNTEACGKIKQQVSSTVIVSDIPNLNSGGALSSAEYRYATDDLAAINSAIAALPKGGTVFFPAGSYGASNGIAIPDNIGLNLLGSAATVGNWWQQPFVGTPITKNQATTIMFLSMTMTGAGIQFVQTVVGHVGQLGMDSIKNISLYAGAGGEWDGGGFGATVGSLTAQPVDGIDILGWTHTTVSECHIFNFAGAGVYITSPPGQGGVSYTVRIRIENDMLNWDGTDIKIGNGASDATFNEGIIIDDNELDASWNNGIDISGTNAIGIEIYGNVIQWSNQRNVSPGYELVAHQGITGGDIHGNYFETIANAATTEILINDGGTASVPGPSIIGNWFWDNGGGTTAIQYGFDATHIALGGVVEGNRFTSGWINCLNHFTQNSSAFSNDCNGTDINWDDNGIVNQCSGVITLAAGVGNSVLRPNSNTTNGTNLAGSCLKNFKNIACVIAPLNNVGLAPATPANTPGVVNCFASPTATATAGMAATATQTAVFAVASTANATYTVLWWGQY